MPFFDQSQFDVRCEWGHAGVEHIAGSDVVIIVDVLSFSTTVDVAAARGARVYPYRYRDEAAAAYARERGAELAGSRSGAQGPWSLSPASMLTIPAGLGLVLPSPNGSMLAFSAKSRGVAVSAGCLRNASAVAKWAMKAGRRITVVPAGERWADGSLRPAVEDLIGAGAIVSRLSGSRSPEANAAAAAFSGARDQLLEQLSLCSSGRELIERGFQRDVELSAMLDVSGSVPVLEGDAFVAKA